jgi:hypothetical protein
MNARSTSPARFPTAMAVALALMMVIPLLPAQGHLIPTTPGAPFAARNAWEGGRLSPTLLMGNLELLDYSVGVAQGETSVVEFSVRNPYGPDEFTIWEFMVAVPASSNAVLEFGLLSRDRGKTIDEGWIPERWTADCMGPEGPNGPDGGTGKIAQGFPYGSCDMLVFRADAGSGLRPGETITFTIAVTIDSATAVCNRIPMGIIGLHVQKDSTRGDHFWGQTVNAQYASEAGGHEITLYVDDLEEETEVIAELSWFTDTDFDGHIDHVALQFNKELDPRTIDKRDFILKPSTPGLPRQDFQVLSVTVRDATTPDPAIICARNSQVWIEIEEKDLPDTGDPPLVTFKQRSGASRLDRYESRILHTLSGQPVVTQDTVESPLDRARPVLMSLLTFIYDDPDDRDLNDHALLTFSEPVTDFGAGFGAATNSLPGANDFQLAPNSGGPLPMDNLAVQARVVAVDAGNNFAGIEQVDEATARRYIVFFDNPNGPMPSPIWPLEWEDLEHIFVSHDSAVERKPNGVDPGQIKPHRIRAETRICDHQRNAVWDFLYPGEIIGVDLNATQWRDRWEPLSTPSIIKVEGDIGKDWLTVHFTGEAHLGACIDRKVLHNQFTIVDGRGPQGVVAATFVEGSERVHLKLDAPLNEKDASGDPSYLRVIKDTFYHDLDSPQKRHVCTKSTTGPSEDGHKPDPEFGFTYSREPWALRTQDEKIVDLTPPKVVYALTRDLDDNGEIDAIDWTFSEPVRDNSFQEGNPGSASVVLDVFGHIQYRRVDVGVKDDANLTISFKALDPLMGMGTHRLPLVQAIPKDIGLEKGRGMVMDLSQHPDVPNRPSGNWMRGGNTSLMNDDKNQFTVYDGAPPRLMRAITMDLDQDGLIDAYKLIFSEPVKDSTFNVAHWRVVDTTPGQEHEYKPTGISKNKLYDPVIDDPIIIMLLDERVPDPNKVPRGDTGLPAPHVLYSAPAGSGLEDMANLPAFLGGPNRLLPIDHGKVLEEDGARPVLMSTLGCIGGSVLRVFYSEAVAVEIDEGAPLRRVLEEDLHHGNTNPGGVTGLQNDSVEHQLGSDNLTVRTRGVLVAGDFGKDFVQSQADRKLNETVSVIEEYNGGGRRALFEKPTLKQASDIFEPQAISKITVVPGGITAGSVHLSFPIPHDDGCLDAGVVDYIVKIQNLDANGTRINPDTVFPLPRVDAELLEWWWFNPVTEKNITKSPLQLLEQDNVGEGETLHVRVHGLLANTNYELTIFPVDRKGNVGTGIAAGKFTAPVSIKTLVDTTAPKPGDKFSIRSPTHPAGKISKNPMPSFEWDAAVDPESIFVNYAFALGKTSTYEPSPLRDPQTRNKTVEFTAQRVSDFTQGRPSGLAPPNWFDDPETWYFTLSACSGGGCTRLGNYTIKVDAPINRTEVLDMNRRVETKVTRDEATGTTTVSWTLPTSGVPCKDQKIGAVQVWRRADDKSPYEALGTFRTGDNTFAQKSFEDTLPGATKKTRYLVTAACEDQVLTFYNPVTKAFESKKEVGAGLFPVDRTPNTNDLGGATSEVKEKPFSTPLWVWIILAILALALIAGIVMFFVMRGRQAEIWQEDPLDTAIESDDEGELPEGAEPAAPVRELGGAYRPPNASDDAATGSGPTHDIKCPSCKQQFQAQGNFPLKVTCPHCGTSGTLR